MAEVDHKKRQVDRIGDCDLRDVHEIFQAPILLGITKIELDLEAQAVEFDDFVVSQIQIGAEQNHMRMRFRYQIGLEDDNHVEWKIKLRVAELALVDIGSKTVFENGNQLFHSSSVYHPYRSG